MSTSRPEWPTLPAGCQRLQRGAFDLLAGAWKDHRFEFTTFGGQLLSWSYKGKDIFFANREHARTDGKVSYRGGNPICFPHFNKGIIFPDKRERSPAHGPVRTAVWNLTELKAESNELRIAASVETQSTDAAPGVPLSLDVLYRFTTLELSMEFTVKNAGARAAAFHLAVHTYFDAPDPRAVRISGLGSEFLDGQNGLRPTPSPEQTLAVVTPLDRVYQSPSREITLQTSTYSLAIHHEQFNNSVVWNPGEPHTLTDVRSPAFICVESAALLPPPSVEAGKRWQGSVRYRPIA